VTVVGLDGPIEEVGGKAAGLAALVRLGLPVPPAVVVPVSAQGVVDDPEGVIARLGEPLAVRSSAVGEDALDRSAAGQFESVMDVTRAGLADAVARVLRSSRSERVEAYGQATSRMAVVVQRQIAASRAGVAFSRDPVTGEDAVLVECVFGPGERLVSGEVAPDRFEIGADARVRARVVPKEGERRLLRTLRDDEVHAVAGLVRRCEEGFGHPVDVEFCFERRVLWLVQCRALTALRAVGA
jgi:phosphoenolpyruvate synthase/pyruvate phosphate dikinase